MKKSCSCFSEVICKDAYEVRDQRFSVFIPQNTVSLLQDWKSEE